MLVWVLTQQKMFHTMLIVPVVRQQGQDFKVCLFPGQANIWVKPLLTAESDAISGPEARCWEQSRSQDQQVFASSCREQQQCATQHLSWCRVGWFAGGCLVSSGLGSSVLQCSAPQDWDTIVKPDKDQTMSWCQEAMLKFVHPLGILVKGQSTSHIPLFWRKTQKWSAMW